MRQPLNRPLKRFLNLPPRQSNRLSKSSFETDKNRPLGAVFLWNVRGSTVRFMLDVQGGNEREVRNIRSRFPLFTRFC